LQGFRLFLERGENLVSAQAIGLLVASSVRIGDD
jgi:hypothetical protein